MSKNKSYLKRLPKAAQKRGRTSRGEVEIVTSRRETKPIESECADDLTGAALGKGGKRLGILLEDEVRLYVRDALRFPSGATRCQMRIIGKTEFDGPNGVAVLPMLDGKIVLREIFRHPTRTMQLEITRGRRELGQTPRQAARTEVKQELGYRVKKLHRLGRVHPETALMSSVIDVFLAELASTPRNDDPESTEALGRIVHVTPDVLARRIVSGRIRDSYTICAFQLAQLRGLIPPVAGGA
jgi:8-oxo-dGTP pyrophosphatase MutT (NUDIX family)